MSHSLPIMEHFYSLQGEGRFTGQAAYFIRLGGCDVACPWCDVKESWAAENHPLTDLDLLVEKVVASGTKIAVITGGEPTLYNLEYLTQILQKNHIRTHIETSGTNPLTGSWDWVCFSPKRYKKSLEEYYKNSNELKMVISHKNDLRWAQELESNMVETCQIYIQPEWSQREVIEPLCIEFIKQHPRWILSLQTHKYLGIE